MSQHDYSIANAAGLAFRNDLNNVLAAIISQNSGATEPTTMVAYMFWADTTSAILKQRNAGNTAWVSLFNMTTNQWLGSVAGNAATITVADAAADTTTWLMLATSQTGDQVPATDTGLTYNASTNMLAANISGSAAGITNAGGQIPFPATQIPSADVNTLDDYEEGTFTGTLNGCTSSPTMIFRYVKVGKSVVITPDYASSFVATSNSTSKYISGLPSALQTAYGAFILAQCSDNGGAVTLATASVQASAGNIYIEANISGGTWTASGSVYIKIPSFSYRID